MRWGNVWELTQTRESHSESPKKRVFSPFWGDVTAGNEFSLQTAVLKSKKKSWVVFAQCGGKGSEVGQALGNVVSGRKLGWAGLGFSRSRSGLAHVDEIPGFPLEFPLRLQCFICFTTSEWFRLIYQKRG